MQELEITVRRLLPIYWLFIWRATIGGAVIGGMFGFAIGFTMAFLHFSREQIGHVTGPAGWLVGVIWSLFVLRMMIEKQYRDFRIVLVARDGAAAPST